jgi:hypothetical protein
MPGPRRKKAKKTPPAFDQKKEVRAIARERVGSVKASRVIVPKAERKAKHKRSVEETE